MTGARADEKSPDRLIALSDGIFAIAMTLLVLDIHVPTGLDADGFREAVGDWLPKLGAYALSFTILAGFWRDHRRILQLAQRVDPLSERIALAGLGVIAVVPFPTAMLSEYATRPLSVVLYALTIAVVDLLQLALFLAIRQHPHTGHGIVADLVSTILVFGATVPIAVFVSPGAAMWSWLALAPIKMAVGRRYAIG
ncbi:TMEM175 family protein [Streptomyces sp. NPDC060035]|uniref:TMEM175 family protein n=1 Tax=Streptomyces sp. NPDC060035 TaxID=3347044 RepID=UPI003689B9D9